MPEAGIVGLPNVGKSTLFNALVKNRQAEAANFPFCTIEPNVGIVNVPECRLERLAKMFNSAKIVPANFKFVDIAGLVKGASEGAGLGNQFLSHIRQVDAIVQVLRCFESEDVHHVDGSVDAMRDMETILLELILADLAVVERRLDRISKGLRAGDKNAHAEAEVLEPLKNTLAEGNRPNIKNIPIERVEHLQLLTLKPTMFVANLAEDELANPSGNKEYSKLKQTEFKIVPVSAHIEAELSTLEPTEASEYLQSLGVSQSGVDSLIREAYDLLGLMNFFTAGETEVRAWNIPKECKAPKAAGVIHTDFERGFIKAEVVSFDDLVSHGSKIAARDAGKVRLEGKEYIVQDGDVIEFKFNV